MRNEIDRANELYVLALRQQSNITFHTFFFYYIDNTTTTCNILTRRMNRFE